MFSYGYNHLGIPEGSVEYRKNSLGSNVTKFRQEVASIEQIEDPQEKWIFLLWVLRQKYPFWFRHLSPIITEPIADQVDMVMRQAFAEIIGRQVSHEEWEQVCLPIKQHGFGLGNIKSVACAAFTANVFETRTHVMKQLPSTAKYLENIDDLNTPICRTTSPRIVQELIEPYRVMKFHIESAAKEVDININLTPSVGESSDELDRRPVKNLQHLYSKALHTKQGKEFLSKHKEAKDLARIYSCEGSVSGMWLYNIPTHAELIMSPNLFRTSCLIRLGMTLPQIPHYCKCRKEIDPHGYHFFTCPHWISHLTIRHDALLRQFIILSNTAGVKVQNQHIASFQQLDENDLRRTDLLLYGMGTNGKNLYTDISIGHPCARSHVSHACKSPGHTLQVINTKKNQKYSGVCANIGASFLPLAFETFGKTSDETLLLIRDLVGKAAEINQLSFSRLLSHWKRRFSTVLQKENALFILNSSSHILFATNRFEPNCEPNLGEVLNLESIHCS